MPPPANQGSRAVLVTWTVITAILFVTATVFAIYFYVDASKVTELSKTNSAKYADIIDDSALGNPTKASTSSTRAAILAGCHCSILGTSATFSRTL